MRFLISLVSKIKPNFSNDIINYYFLNVIEMLKNRIINKQAFYSIIIKL